MKITRYPLWPAERPVEAAAGDESLRARVIAAHGADAVEDDRELTAIVDFAAQLCGVPTALVTIVEEKRQRFLARSGMEERNTPRSISFCAHAMIADEAMVVVDAAQDARFADNPVVTGGPGVRFYAGHPLVSSEGVPLGALCVLDTEPRPEGLTDLQRNGLAVLAGAVMRRLTSERETREAENILTHSEQRMRQLAEHLPVYAWAANLAGDVEYANAALFDFAGVRDLAEFDLSGLIHPDDLTKVVQVRAASREKLTKWEAKARVRRADGAYRWMLLRAWPFVTGDKPPEIWFGAAVDVNDLQAVSESRDLLARELSHRIKNIFAVVSSLIALQSREHPESADFAKALSDTVRTLGRAHDYVRPHEGRKGSSLAGLVEELLTPYGKTRGGRISVEGAGCPIGEKSATPMALIFHELATNSAKYGALSHGDGQLSVYIVDGADGSDDVIVNWHERGLGEPATRDENREGFGSRLLRTAIEGQLNGKFERRIAGDALEVVLTIPCDALAA